MLDEGPDRSLGDALTRAVVANALGATAATGTSWLLSRTVGPAPWARSVAMATLIGTQLGQALTAGGRDPVVLVSVVGSPAILVVVVQTPGLGTFFGCMPLGPVGWSLAIGNAAVGTLISRAAPSLLADHLRGSASHEAPMADPPGSAPSARQPSDAAEGDDQQPTT